MKKPPTKPRTYPVGTLQRAIAEAATRAAKGESVAPGDLGGVRKIAGVPQE
jgi:hypothetical protein